jgi:V8-like Glu-specific endopeptidase
MRLLATGLLSILSLFADEGMWTFNNFPSEKVRQAYGFAPTQQWLDEVRLSSVRLAQGCSGSFVSPEGLILTNHHCVSTCIQQLSTPEKDLMAGGFFAATLAEERRCPNFEVNQLIAITDVTAEVTKATSGLEGAKFGEASRAEFARLEKACATSEDVRCDVVTLYGGGQYNLYKYRRYQDTRLVFAPEFAIAFFGGDPDNFTFPRYDLDMAFLRIYENGAPVKTPHHFRWSRTPAKEGDLTFVTGHPGGTDRNLTIAQLAYQRDHALPNRLMLLAELRGMFTQYATRGAEQERTVNNSLFGVENSLKALRGQREALVNTAFFGQKAAAERAFRDKVNADPKLRAAYGGAWDRIAAAVARTEEIRKEYNELEASLGAGSDLIALARSLVRWAEEKEKPNELRLREFTDSAVPVLRQRVLSPAPVYPELEIEKITFALSRLREQLGAGHEAVRAVLGKRSPRDIATEAVTNTTLKSADARKALFEGGKAALDASADPMLALYRKLDPFARAIRKTLDDEIQPVLQQAGGDIAKARFAVFGTSIYPDATFTLRLSYGSVKGYVENGRTVNPITILGGAFERHTGSDPYALPESWLNNKDRLDLTTPFNMATTNDIIGGNSGSPVINKDREIVGLIFDGNIQSLGGNYGFDESVNRAVSVHSAAMAEALRKIYRAQRLLDELGITR